MNTRNAIACAAFTVTLAGAAHSAVTDFDVLVTSGGFNGGNNAVLRFSGSDGSFRGVFADQSTGGLNDPRDIVLDGPFGDPNSTVLVNSGNAPAAPGNDRILRFDQAGNFIEELSDFSTTGAGFVDPGGAVFGPNGNFFVGSRAQGSVLEFDSTNGSFVGEVFDPTAAGIDFPRGFVFGPSGDLFIGNGSNPSTGVGQDAILRIDPAGNATTLFDTSNLGAFSPLDVILSPDGSRLVVSSEFPFQGGAIPNAGSIVVIDIDNPTNFSVLNPGNDEFGDPILSAPRGLGFAPDGTLFASSTGNGRLLRFDIDSREFLGVFAEFDGLNGQALNFVNVPAPGAASIAGLGLIAAMRRRRD